MSMPDTPVTLIKDIRPGLRQLTSDFIVLEILESTRTKTKEGKDVATIKVADSSGSINIVLYGDYIAALQPSDVLRMTHGYAVVNRGAMCLYMAKHGSLTKIGEFCFLFSETPNMSEMGAPFLNEHIQSQQQNGRGTSPPSLDMPPEPPAILNGFAPNGQQQQGRFPTQQDAWQQQTGAPFSDASGRLQPPFDVNSGRTSAGSPPQSASSPPPTDGAQPIGGPRVIPAQSAFPPVSVAPVSSAPVDPRAGRQNRYHPYQQQQQQQQQSQQRQPLQPIGSGPGSVKAPQPQSQALGPPTRTYNAPPRNAGGPPVIPANSVGFRSSAPQHSASVRR